MLHIPEVVGPEREKYEQIWAQPDYKKFSPGLQNVERFMKVIEPTPGQTLIDIGCGAGVAGLEFQKRGLTVSFLDLTGAALEDGVYAFVEEPVWSHKWWRHRKWDYGFCCDVLEHIPPEYTMLSVARIMEACHCAWLQINFDPDLMGSLIGKPLHLTVQSYTWWLGRLATLGKVIDARDLCGMGVFVMESH